MSDDEGPREFDLSGLPEPLRSVVGNQLAKMPAPLREKLLREGSPLLDRMIAKARERSRDGGTASLPSSAAESRPGRDVISGNDAASIARTASLKRVLETKRLPTVSPGDSVNQVGWLGVIGFALILALAWAMYAPAS